MTQIEVWDQTSKDLEGDKLVLFWADKMCAICEYVSMETRIKNLPHLFPLMEKVCDRYSSARTKVKEL